MTSPPLFILSFVLPFLILLSFTNAQEPQIPSLPESFSINIEMTLGERRSTMDLVEYYDNVHQRSRFEGTINGVSTIQIRDYSKPRFYVVREGECYMADIPMGSGNASRFSQPPSSIFRFHDSHVVSSRYLGKEDIRGIPTHSWMLDFVEENLPETLTYSARYFFAEDWWDMTATRNSTHRLPSRVYVNGTFQNFDRPTEERRFEHTYEFFNYDIGVPDPSLFEIHRDMPCKPLGKTMPPPELPPDFHTTIEVTDRIHQTTSIMKEFYDYSNNRISFVTILRDLENHLIIDLNTNITTLATWKNETLKSCNVKPKSIANFLLTEHHHLVSSRDLFHLGDDPVYAGRMWKRDIEVEMWKTHVRMQLETGIREYDVSLYFPAESWSLPGKPTDSDDWNILIAMDMKGTYTNIETQQSVPIDVTYDYIDFEANAGPESYYYVPPSVLCHNIEKKPLPTPPNTWHAVIEAKDSVTQRGWSFSEYYDVTTDHRRTDFSLSGLNTVMKNIYDYSLGTFTQIFGNDNCTIYPFDPSESGFSNRSRHLQTTAQLWEFSSNSVFQGEIKVRGRLCEYWSSELKEESSSFAIKDYRVSHYFLKQPVVVGENQTIQVPVRVEFKGVMKYKDRNGTITRTMDTDTMMDIIDFVTEVPTDAFLPPQYMLCKQLPGVEPTCKETCRNGGQCQLNYCACLPPFQGPDCSLIPSRVEEIFVDAPSSSKFLSPGAAAALVVIFFIVGAVLGVLAFFVFFRTTSSEAAQRAREEMEEVKKPRESEEIDLSFSEPESPEEGESL